jgi:hypothetical protein
LRFVYLDADPDYYAWAGYITDEGRWVAHARELSLFGRIINGGDELLHLLVAPLFQAVTYAVFRVLGVSFWTARLLPAISGSAILILFWLLLRRVVSASAVLAALALLAFDVDLLMLSRVAIPEVPAMLLELAAYAILVTGRPTPRRMFAAGLLVLGTLAMKATTLPIILIFSVIVLLQPAEGGNREHRWRNLVFFWAGLGSLVVLTAPVYLVFFWRHAAAVVSSGSVIKAFLGLAGLYAYAAFPFESDFAATFNVFALGICFAMVGWITRSSDPVEPRLRRYFVTSAVWYGMYALLMQSTTYFPDRYKVHVLTPMAIGIATGLSVLQKGGLTAVREALLRMTPRWRVLTLGLLTLPTGALWAPAVAHVIGFSGIDQTRLRTKLICVAIAVCVAFWAVRHRAHREDAVLRFFSVFPIVGLLAWLLAMRAGLVGSFWPAIAGSDAGGWALGAAISTVLSGLLARLGRSWERMRWPVLIPAAALSCATLTVARVAPSYVHPHYTMKASSEQLGLLLAETPEGIASSNAEGLFNGNALPYRSVFGMTWPHRKPERIVIAFQFDDPERSLERDYTLIATYRLSLSPEYKNEHPVTPDPAAKDGIVRVYRRNAGG